MAGHLDRIEIRVRDHGAGVSAAFAAHLYERFSRDPFAHQHSDGSGLGLWIVRSLARANSGEAWYQAHHDSGACFCLRLRRAAPHRHTDNRSVRSPTT